MTSCNSTRIGDRKFEPKMQWTRHLQFSVAGNVRPQAVWLIRESKTYAPRKIPSSLQNIFGVWTFVQTSTDWSDSTNNSKMEDLITSSLEMGQSRTWNFVLFSVGRLWCSTPPRISHGSKSVSDFHRWFQTSSLPSSERRLLSNHHKIFPEW